MPTVPTVLVTPSHRTFGSSIMASPGIWSASYGHVLVTLVLIFNNPAGPYQIPKRKECASNEVFCSTLHQCIHHNSDCDGYVISRKLLQEKQGNNRSPKARDDFHPGRIPKYNFSQTQQQQSFIVADFVEKFFMDDDGDKMGMAVFAVQVDGSLGHWQWSLDGKMWQNLSSKATPEDVSRVLRISSTYEGLFEVSDALLLSCNVHSSQNGCQSVSFTTTLLHPGYHIRFLPSAAFTPDPGGTTDKPWGKWDALANTRLIFAAWDAFDDDDSQMTKEVMLPECGTVCGNEGSLSRHVAIMHFECEMVTCDKKCKDCNGIRHGDAFWDCGKCVKSPIQRDCAKQCEFRNQQMTISGKIICLPVGIKNFRFCDGKADSGAFVDLCGICVGGSTGLPPSEQPCKELMTTAESEELVQKINTSGKEESVQVTSAVLSNDLCRLEITFTEPVEGPQECVDIFDLPDDMMLGKGSTCIFSGYKLLVTLGTSSRLEAESKLKFRASILKCCGTNSSLSIADAFIVGRAQCPQQPKFELSSSSVCDNQPFTLTLVLVEGAGTHPLTLQWSVHYEALVATKSRKENLAIWDNVREFQKQLHEAGPKFQGDSVQIDSSMLWNNLRYKLSVKGVNYQGKESAIQTVEFKQSNSTMDLQLQLLGPSLILPKTKVVLEATPSSCNPDIAQPVQVNYYWTVNASSETTVKVELQRGRRLILLPGTLDGGFTYNFTCLAVLEKNLAVLAKSSRMVSVSTAGPSAQLSIVFLSVGTEQGFFLDAGDSVDLDGLPGHLSFSWSCRAVTGLLCFVAPDGNGPQRLESWLNADVLSNPVLQIPRRVLPVGSYTFTVTAFKGGKSSEAEANVTVFPGSPPIVLARSPSTSAMDPNLSFKIEGMISAPEGARAFWEISFENDSKPLSLLGSQRDFSELVEQMDFPLLVPAGTLKPGASYQIRLVVTHPQAGNGSCVVKVVMAIPPQPGTFQVTPSEGESLRTKFFFTARRWYSPDESQPLTFSFGYRFSQGKNLQFFRSITINSPDAQEFLPAGILPNGSAVVIPVLQVCDVNSICVRKESQAIVVHFPTSFESQELQVIQREFAARMSAQETTEALTLAHATFLTLHKKTDSKIELDNMAAEVQDSVRKSISNHLQMQLNQDSLPLNEAITIMGTAASTLESLQLSEVTIQRLLHFKDSALIHLAPKEKLMASSDSNVWKLSRPRPLEPDDVRNLLRPSELALMSDISLETKRKEMAKLLDDVKLYLGGLCMASYDSPLTVESSVMVLGMQKTMFASLNINKWMVPIGWNATVSIGVEVATSFTHWNCKPEVVTSGASCEGICLGTAAFPMDYLSQMTWEKRQKSVILQIQLFNPSTSSLVTLDSMKEPFLLEMPLNTSNYNDKELKCLWWNQGSWRGNACMSELNSSTSVPVMNCKCQQLGYFGIFDMSVAIDADIPYTELPRDETATQITDSQEKGSTESSLKPDTENNNEPSTTQGSGRVNETSGTVPAENSPSEILIPETTTTTTQSESFVPEADNSMNSTSTYSPNSPQGTYENTTGFKGQSGINETSSTRTNGQEFATENTKNGLNSTGNETNTNPTTENTGEPNQSQGNQEQEKGEKVPEENSTSVSLMTKLPENSTIPENSATETDMTANSTEADLSQGTYKNTAAGNEQELEMKNDNNSTKSDQDLSTENGQQSYKPENQSSMSNMTADNKNNTTTQEEQKTVNSTNGNSDIGQPTQGTGDQNTQKSSESPANEMGSETDTFPNPTTNTQTESQNESPVTESNDLYTTIQTTTKWSSKGSSLLPAEEQITTTGTVSSTLLSVPNNQKDSTDDAKTTESEKREKINGTKTTIKSQMNETGYGSRTSTDQLGVNDQSTPSVSQSESTEKIYTEGQPTPKITSAKKDQNPTVTTVDEKNQGQTPDNDETVKKDISSTENNIQANRNGMQDETSDLTSEKIDTDRNSTKEISDVTPVFSTLTTAAIGNGEPSITSPPSKHDTTTLLKSSEGSFKLPTVPPEEEKITPNEILPTVKSVLPTEQSNAPDDSIPKLTSAIPISIDFMFSLDEDYNRIVGTRKEEFEAYLTKQIADLLRVSTRQIANLRVKPGSIVVTLQLVVDPNGGGRSPMELYEELQRLLAENKLKLEGFEGQPLKTALLNLDKLIKTKALTDSMTRVIIGVVTGSIALCLLGVGLYVWYWRQQKEKIRPIQGAHNLNQGTAPIYRPLKFEHCLEGGVLPITRQQPLLPPSAPPTANPLPKSPSQFIGSGMVTDNEIMLKYCAQYLPGTPDVQREEFSPGNETKFKTRFEDKSS